MVKPQREKIRMNIPSVIKQQLLCTNPIIVGSWAAHGWIATAYNTLIFKVNAHHFKGIISITLDEAQDLYNIHFYNNHTHSSFIKNKKLSKKFMPISGVFCDQLVELIDDNIERIDAYN